MLSMFNKRAKLAKLENEELKKELENLSADIESQKILRDAEKRMIEDQKECIKNLESKIEKEKAHVNRLNVILEGSQRDVRKLKRENKELAINNEELQKEAFVNCDEIKKENKNLKELIKVKDEIIKNADSRIMAYEKTLKEKGVGVYNPLKNQTELMNKDSKVIDSLKVAKFRILRGRLKNRKTVRAKNKYVERLADSMEKILKELGY